jgi:hypothetical protein
MSSGGKPQWRSETGSDLIALMPITRRNTGSDPDVCIARPSHGSHDIVVSRQKVLSHV